MKSALVDILNAHAPLTIAVSGGVDSMTLAHVAAKVLGPRVTMAHAVSPAVPAAATSRVRTHAEKEGWQLKILDAGEFADGKYRANPVNRCFFCKQNLYGAVAGLTDGRVASGTNCDDLNDFRPGLLAAEAADVIHPFVEAKMKKTDVYRLAGILDLEDLAALPAQPCLASRVETGIRIEPRDMAFIDDVETALSAEAGPGAVLRCRITHDGVLIELGDPRLSPRIVQMAQQMTEASGRVWKGTRAYRKGAAFLRQNL